MKLFCFLFLLIALWADGNTRAEIPTLDPANGPSLLSQIKSESQELKKFIQEQVALVSEPDLKNQITDSWLYSVGALEKKFGPLNLPENLQKVFGNPEDKSIVDLLNKSIDQVKQKDFVRLTNALSKKSAGLANGDSIKIVSDCQNQAALKYGFQNLLVNASKTELELLAKYSGKTRQDVESEIKSSIKRIANKKGTLKISAPAFDIYNDSELEKLLSFLTDLESFFDGKTDAWQPANEKFFESWVMFSQIKNTVYLNESRLWKVLFADLSSNALLAFSDALRKISKDKKIKTLAQRKKSLFSIFESIAEKGDDYAKQQLKAMTETNCYLL